VFYKELVKKAKMKIAYFTESLPPLTDGVSRTLSYLQKSLKKENIDYRFFSPFKPLSDDWEDKVHKIISVPFPLYTRYRVSIPALHDLKHLLRNFKPDLIHICSPIFLGAAGNRYAKEMNIPVVNSFHTRFVSYSEYYRLSWFESYAWNYLRWFYNQGDISVVPSQTTIDELKLKGFKNLRLWARGIDTSRFSPAFADLNLKNRWSPEGDPVALFAGRLVREKDVETLLKAHQILKSKNIKYKLVMVGGGPMKHKIEKTAPDVIMTGHLEGEELSKAYASADIFAFPSTTESFGNVVQEAAASGLPAIGASEGGVKDLISDGETGFLTKPKDPHDFAAKMEQVLINKELRNSLAANALNYAISKSWDHINNGLFEKYRNLIEKYQSGSARELENIDEVSETVSR